MFQWRWADWDSERNESDEEGLFSAENNAMVIEALEFNMAHEVVCYWNSEI